MGQPPPQLAERLAGAGCVAPDEEADELWAASRGDGDRLESMVKRRVTGEPLAWITGSVVFAGCVVEVDPGVFVPRVQTELLVEVARAWLPAGGRAVDLCTGSGAVAVALAHARPDAEVLATDIDPVACRCARRNGVTVFRGSFGDPLPARCVASVDVVTAVAPYVPTEEMEFLPRDVLRFEPALALDGGRHGIELTTGVIAAAARLLRRGGQIVVEAGGDQDRLLTDTFGAYGFGPVEPHRDEDGDLRALSSQWYGLA